MSQDNFSERKSLYTSAVVNISILEHDCGPEQVEKMIPVHTTGSALECEHTTRLQPTSTTISQQHV